MTANANDKPTGADDLGRHMVPGSSFGQPVIIRGRACQVVDEDGTQYLDLEAGPGVLSVGHCHPKVVDAIRDQAGTLLQGPGRNYSRLTVDLAKRMTRASDDRFT